MSESKALQRQWSLLPSTFGEAMEVATVIAKSEFAPKSYAGKPHSVLIAIQMGADIGLAPMQSLQNIAVINGRPSLWGDAALALAMPVLEKFKEFHDGTPFQDDYKAVCVAKRKGWPDETIRAFSVADAKKAGLWPGRPQTPWATYPNRMLQMRARGFTLRDVAPDRLMGFILAEEAQDLPTVNGETSVGGGATAQAKSMTVFEELAEPLRDSIEKGFANLHFSAAQRLQKINEYFGGADVVPDEVAVTLQGWLRDEYAKRKSGEPRVKADGNKKKPAPPIEAPPEPPAEALEFP